MKFTDPRDADRLAFQHPKLVELILAFDVQHKHWAAADPTFPPEATITCLDRDEGSNAQVGGKAKSWHLWRCAVDFRSKHYEFQQAARAIDWLRERCPQPMWELVLVPHGTGPHFHVAVRDFSWRVQSK